MKISIIPKEKRYKGVDLIKIEWASDDDIKEKFYNFFQKSKYLARH